MLTFLHTVYLDREYCVVVGLFLQSRQPLKESTKPKIQQLGLSGLKLNINNIANSEIQWLSSTSLTNPGVNTPTKILVNQVDFVWLVSVAEQTV